MRALNRITAASLKTLPVGKHCDGGGLWLFKRPDGGAQWIYRYAILGRRTELGLGALADVSLADARRQSEHWRRVLKSGGDPKAERDRERRRSSKALVSFGSLFELAFEARKAELKGGGAAGRWDSPLRVHVLPTLKDVPAEAVDQTVIRDILSPIWHEKPEAARKALNRIRIVLKYGAAMGLNVDLQGPEKAKALLGAQRHSPKHVPSMPWRDVPAFYQSLEETSVGVLALKLLILTAARSGEVRLCALDEIEGNLWTIPGERMKASKEHRIPLSAEALRIVEAARPFARGGRLFPGKGRSVISDMTMSAFLKRRELEARPHGFRASFRTWCAEATDTPREIAETCLAHTSASAVEAAYRRTDYLEQRRDLMQRWARHLTEQ